MELALRTRGFGFPHLVNRRCKADGRLLISSNGRHLDGRGNAPSRAADDFRVDVMLRPFSHLQFLLGTFHLTLRELAPYDE